MRRRYARFLLGFGSSSPSTAGVSGFLTSFSAAVFPVAAACSARFCSASRAALAAATMPADTIEYDIGPSFTGGESVSSASFCSGISLLLSSPGASLCFLERRRRLRRGFCSFAASAAPSVFALSTVAASMSDGVCGFSSVDFSGACLSPALPSSVSCGLPFLRRPSLFLAFLLLTSPLPSLRRSSRLLRPLPLLPPRLLPDGARYSGPSPSPSGIGFFVISFSMNFSMSLNLPISLSLTRVMAMPSLSARAVRPTRCT